MKSTFINRAHLEGARGSFESNFKYCYKDGIVTEFGDKPKQGKRTDIQVLHRLVEEGASFDEILKETDGTAWMYESRLHKMINHKKKAERVALIKEKGVHALPPKVVRFYWVPLGQERQVLLLGSFQLPISTMVAVGLMAIMERSA